MTTFMYKPEDLERRRRTFWLPPFQGPQTVADLVARAEAESVPLDQMRVEGGFRLSYVGLETEEQHQARVESYLKREADHREFVKRRYAEIMEDES